MTLPGIGSAFWGVVAGALALMVQHYRSRAYTTPAEPATVNLLFVADPLECFKTYKDTTFAMMREAAARGHGLWACEPAHLLWQRGAAVRRAGAARLA